MREVVCSFPHVLIILFVPVQQVMNGSASFTGLARETIHKQCTKIIIACTIIVIINNYHYQHNYYCLTTNNNDGNASHQMDNFASHVVPCQSVPSLQPCHQCDKPPRVSDSRVQKQVGFISTHGSMYLILLLYLSVTLKYRHRNSLILDLCLVICSVTILPQY